MSIAPSEVELAKREFAQNPVPYGLNGKPKFLAVWIDAAGEASGCSLTPKSQELSNYIAQYLKTRQINDKTISQAFGETRNSFLMPTNLEPFIDWDYLKTRSEQPMMNSVTPGELAAMKAESKRQLGIRIWLATGQMMGDAQLNQLMDNINNAGEEWSNQRQGRIQANAEMMLLRATRTTMVQRPGR
jgi:hypothetical protein